VAVAAGPVRAQEAPAATASVSEAAAPAKAKAPWRGSSLTLRTEASAISLDKGADLTYNPYAALAFSVNPRWWFGDWFYTSLDFSLARELTEADDTTKAGETWLGDLAVGVGASRFWTIPYAGIDLSAELKLITPTSKVSQARSLLVGLRGSFKMSRTFPVLEGLTVFYAAQGLKNFNRYTTAQLDSPLIPGCVGDASTCDRFSNTGYRNASGRLANAVGVSMDFLPWLGASVGFTHVMDFLYAAQDDDPRISVVPQQPTDTRYLLAYDAELTFTPMKSLQLGLGASTINPQLAPDSSYRQPFVNRYTLVYLDVRLLVDGLVDQIVSAVQ